MKILSRQSFVGWVDKLLPHDIKSTNKTQCGMWACFSVARCLFKHLMLPVWTQAFRPIHKTTHFSFLKFCHSIGSFFSISISSRMWKSALMTTKWTTWISSTIFVWKEGWQHMHFWLFLGSLHYQSSPNPHWPLKTF